MVAAFLIGWLVFSPVIAHFVKPHPPKPTVAHSQPMPALFSLLESIAQSSRLSPAIAIKQMTLQQNQLTLTISAMDQGAIEGFKQNLLQQGLILRTEERELRNDAWHMQIVLDGPRETRATAAHSPQNLETVAQALKHAELTPYLTNIKRNEKTVTFNFQAVSFDALLATLISLTRTRAMTPTMLAVKQTINESGRVDGYCVVA